MLDHTLKCIKYVLNLLNLIKYDHLVNGHATCGFNRDQFMDLCLICCKIHCTKLQQFIISALVCTLFRSGNADILGCLPNA